MPPGVRLAVGVRHRLAQRLDDFAPEAIHIATEGPLGFAARRYCTKRRLFFTTAYHTNFPEYFRARFGIPLPWGYAALRHFHARSELCMTSRRHPAGIRENCPGQRSVGAASQWGRAHARRIAGRAERRRTPGADADPGFVCCGTELRIVRSFWAACPCGRCEVPASLPQDVPQTVQARASRAAPA